MTGGSPVAQLDKGGKGRWLSSFVGLVLILLILGWGPATAHEIRPAIADVLLTENQVDISITLSVEPLAIGLNLNGLDNTNDSPLSNRYEQLRGLNPADLEREFSKNFENILAGFTLLAGENPIHLSLVSLYVPEVGDVGLSRESVLYLTAELPDDGSPVTFGWVSEFGPLVVRQTTQNDDGYSALLTGGELSIPMERGQSIQQPWIVSFLDFIGIGFEHIVPKGLDHILFVLGLFFFSLKLRPLLTQVTAFTLAHTVTLALATLGFVQIPASIVEPLIAASIVYVAVENLMVGKLKPWRTAVVFGFGLLHGLGFAAVLGDIGLDPGRFITGLIGFNLGVELGQLTVISAAFLTVGYWFGSKPWYRRVIAGPASIGIAIMGAYWFVERVFL